MLFVISVCVCVLWIEEKEEEENEKKKKTFRWKSFELIASHRLKIYLLYLYSTLQNRVTYSRSDRKGKELRK